MGSQILRPTSGKREKGDWLIQGSWGRRTFPDTWSRIDLYQQLYRELVESGVLAPNSPAPSNRYHAHITTTLYACSWIQGRWVADEPFGNRLRRLRDKARMTQEQLAEMSGLDLATVRQLEQGTRTNPQWQTVCALARGLAQDVVVFVGTDSWEPPELENLAKKKERAEKSQVIETDIVIAMESLGHSFDRENDRKRRAEMMSMTKLELHELAKELKTAGSWQDGITMIVAAITRSKAARRLEEDKKYKHAGPARLDMFL